MPGQTDNWGPKCSGQMDSQDPHAQVSWDTSNRHPITQDRQMPTANKHPAPTYTYSGQTDRHPVPPYRQTPGIHTPRTDRKLRPPSAQDRRAPTSGTPGSPGHVGAVGGAPGKPRPLVAYLHTGRDVVVYLHTGRGQLCMLRRPALADPILGGGGGVPVITSPRPLGPPRLTGGPVQPSGAFPLPNTTGEVFAFFL